MNQSVKNIKGPETNGNSKEFELPDCIQIKTEQDELEFKRFVSSVVKAANDNALDHLADYVAAQNIKMTELVKKLSTA